MSHERLEMRLTWGARKENVDQCADRLRSWLGGLGKIHPLLAKWYEDKASEAGRRFNIASRLADLKETLTTSMQHTANGVRPLPALGVRASFWGGAGYTRCIATFDVACGAYARGIANGCSLNLFVTHDDATELLDVTRLTEVFRLAMKCWEPDHGSMGFLDCDEYLAKRFPDFDEFKVKCSWFTLIGNTAFAPQKKLGFQCLSLLDGKNVVIACQDRFAKNPRRHAGSIYRLTRQLN